MKNKAVMVLLGDSGRYEVPVSVSKYSSQNKPRELQFSLTAL